MGGNELTSRRVVFDDMPWKHFIILCFFELPVIISSKNGIAPTSVKNARVLAIPDPNQVLYWNAIIRS